MNASAHPDAAQSPSLRDQAATFGLSSDEFTQVVTHLGREPNALETAMFGALWSEHCGYKNSRPLLKRLPTTGASVLQGPGENAGVVDIGDGFAVAFKMESHNHPSAVEPVQGAATGVGGILRDIFAMGARPFAVLDSLRFGELSDPRTRYLLNGVVEGIAHYGNAIGVPTVGGEVTFSACYAENPLVNVMALGLMRHEALQSGTVGEVGNRLIYVGSKTGRDGLGGAVFASAELSETSDADRPAVQVGDPFMEKLLLEACLEAIEAGLVIGVQDMGAAGLTSSVAEMAYRAGRGVDLWVDRVPRREVEMSALEVMLSESQERMVLSAKPGCEAELLALLERWELDAVEVGEVAPHRFFRLLEEGRVVGEMPVAALNEAPTYTREGIEAPEIRAARETPIDVPVPDLSAALLTLLSSPTIASKRAIFRRYDHQVMTNTVVLPGEADAAVLRVKGSERGVAATTDCTPRYGFLDPELGAQHAVAEAARNLACVGATPLAITNNLNFGNPTRSDVYYQMSRSVDGLAAACLALSTPVTGGNVSLYNQYRTETGVRAVYPTLTVGMVGVLPDVSRYATTGFKRDGDVVLLVGDNTDELGASEYLAQVHRLTVGRPPRLELARARALVEGVSSLIQAGLCDTAHDVSDGGLAVALAEMALSGDRGATVTLGDALRPDALLFGEAASRVLLAVPAAQTDAVLEHLRAYELPVQAVGETGGEGLTLTLTAPDTTVNVSLADLRHAFESPLRDALEG